MILIFLVERVLAVPSPDLPPLNIASLAVHFCIFKLLSFKFLRCLAPVLLQRERFYTYTPSRPLKSSLY